MAVAITRIVCISLPPFLAFLMLTLAYKQHALYMQVLKIEREKITTIDQKILLVEDIAKKSKKNHLRVTLSYLALITCTIVYFITLM